MEENVFCIEGSEKYFPEKVQRLSLGELGKYDEREINLGYETPEIGIGEIGSIDFTFEKKQIPTRKTKKGNPTGWELTDTVSMIALEIRPEHRRKGYGTRMVRRVEQIARERELDTVFVYRTNTHSCKMIKKLGYKKVDFRSRDMFRKLK